MVTWDTDELGTSFGWTLIVEPVYPDIPVPDETVFYGSATGLRFQAVFGGAGAAHPVTEDASQDAVSATTATVSDFLLEAGGSDYLETYDYIRPNTTCDATTMTCPLPHTWAHINYNPNATEPEPAEGSCVQNKFGSSPLGSCHEVVLGGAGHRWAGNCGDAVSYFWFEKTACGARRSYDTGISMIIDAFTATPDQGDIDMILGLYDTSKAPEVASLGGGITWNTEADYHIAPLLPPVD